MAYRRQGNPGELVNIQHRLNSRPVYLHEREIKKSWQETYRDEQRASSKSQAEEICGMWKKRLYGRPIRIL